MRSTHICLNSELVEMIFGTTNHAYVAYVKDRGRLLITPASSRWFVKMYEATQFLLKSRNMKGDKALAIRAILIDNNIDMSDRELPFEVVKKSNLIKIHIE